MNKNIITLSELIEHSSEAIKLLVSNEIDMGNGNIKDAQKHFKDATNLLSVMLKDIFVEVKDILTIKTSDMDEFDFSTLDVAKLLTNVIYNAGGLIGLLENGQTGAVTKAVETKLLKSINSVEALANALFFN